MGYNSELLIKNIVEKYDEYAAILDYFHRY